MNRESVKAIIKGVMVAVFMMLFFDSSDPAFWVGMVALNIAILL